MVLRFLGLIFFISITFPVKAELQILKNNLKIKIDGEISDIIASRIQEDLHSLIAELGRRSNIPLAQRTLEGIRNVPLPAIAQSNLVIVRVFGYNQQNQLHAQRIGNGQNPFFVSTNALGPGVGGHAQYIHLNDYYPLPNAPVNRVADFLLRDIPVFNPMNHSHSEQIFISHVLRIPLHQPIFTRAWGVPRHIIISIVSRHPMCHICKATFERLLRNGDFKNRMLSNMSTGVRGNLVGELSGDASRVDLTVSYTSINN